MWQRAPIQVPLLSTLRKAQIKFAEEHKNEIQKTMYEVFILYFIKYFVSHLGFSCTRENVCFEETSKMKVRMLKNQNASNLKSSDFIKDQREKYYLQLQKTVSLQSKTNELSS